MKKLDRIRVLAPLYLALYIGALIYVESHSIWGNVLLAALDVLGLFVAALIARRVVEGRKMSSWSRVAPKLFWAHMLLIGMAILHLVGACMPTPELQQLFAYLTSSIGFLVFAGFAGYLFDDPEY
jgi:hypothetical protein